MAETDIREALDSRLTALARSHDIFAQENWEGASLVEVVRRSLMPFVVRGKLEDRILIDGEDVRFMPAPALSLGMGFHELATNAAKYGALSVSEGIVEVSWTRKSEGEEAVRLTWRERNGPAVSPPKQKSFGSRLIERALAYEMNGTAKVNYALDGLRFEISIPETALQGHSP